MRRRRWRPTAAAFMAALVLGAATTLAGADSAPAAPPPGDDSAAPAAAATQPDKQPSEPATAQPWTFHDVVDKVPGLQGGFFDMRAGARLFRDPYELRQSLAEIRLQLDFEHQLRAGGATVKLRPDFLFDPVPERRGLDLEEGSGWLDLREANVLVNPTGWMDVKAGRQILTWGTGDLVFLNDMFPKDWKSFFIGRDVEYLKAPSDAVKVSLYNDLADFDVVWTPRFDSDRYIEGDRLSYWNSMQGRRSGTFVHVDKPDDWVSDSEAAWRFSRNLKGYELAVYGYYGFWKSPEGFEPATGKAAFPALSTYGFSARGNLGKGIANVEAAYYDSRDDRGGDDPFVPNSQARVLLGYTQEIGQDFTLGTQYYLEHMLDHSNYDRTLPAGMPEARQDRHVVTVRLTKSLMNQNLRLSLFAYYSPSDNDAYIRPNISYKISDAWSAETGANFLFGSQPYTFFSQFERDSNWYAGLRYSF